MLEMRSVTADEFVQWCRAEARAHGNRLDNDPEVLRPHFDLDRSIAVFDQMYDLNRQEYGLDGS